VKSKTEINTSELCTNCGLCCDGTLFDDIPISSDDIFMETAESKGYNSLVIAQFIIKLGLQSVKVSIVQD
jgi:hypothetical protein